MNKPELPSHKSPVSHLSALNLVVALLAGIISITGGIYSLKSNLFAGPEFGSLQGIVRDEKIARPLKLASVEITDLTGAVVNTATTDDDGHYSIEALKTGNYVVKFTAPIHRPETKTIKIEKNIWSAINVDLVPEVSQMNPTPAEYAASVQKNIPVPSTPQATYQTATPVASGYNTTGNTSSVATVPSSTYAQPDSQMNAAGDSNYPDSQYSGSRRPSGRRPPGGYGNTSSTSSQGDALAQVGTQLLSALISKKSNNN